MRKKQYFITNDSTIDFTSEEEFSNYAIDEYTVFYHKDVESTLSRNENCTVAILGFIIDPYQPKASNQEIANTLTSCTSKTDFFKSLEKLSGKYVVLYHTKEETILVTDCFAERQLYYWKNNDCYYISSSDKLILDSLSLQPQIAPEKQALLQDSLFLHINEHWLLSEEDWDDRFKKLLPNHYLDILHHTVDRLPIFAPHQLDKKTVALEVQMLLKNTIEALTLRYDNILLPITAGYDSRLLLAASIDWKDHIAYYIFNTGRTYVRRDVKIAKRLAQIFTLNFKEIKVQELSDAFKKKYADHFIAARFLSKTRNIAWFDTHIKKPTINISGGGGYLRGVYDEASFTSTQEICKAIEYDHLPIHEKAIQDWLVSVSAYAKEYNLDISDLFYHELRMGKWASKMYHESDMTDVEYFSPLNNRHLIFSILRNIPTAQLHKPTSPFYRTLIKAMLPKAATIPFNPKTWRDHIKSMIPYDRIKKQVRLLRYGKG
ncbi:MAG: hypothetical protein ACI9Y7_000864 [Dokdonia sp.]